MLKCLKCFSWKKDHLTLISSRVSEEIILNSSQICQDPKVYNQNRSWYELKHVKGSELLSTDSLFMNRHFFFSIKGFKEEHLRQSFFDFQEKELSLNLLSDERETREQYNVLLGGKNSAEEI